MSPIKRKPSRSPEGQGHQRKSLRNDSVSTSNDSRKNSDVNTSLIDASADPRQNRGIVSNIVRSPGSTDGSTYQDAANSRSTPRPANLKAGSVIAVSHEEGGADEATMSPLLGSLVSLLALVRAESSIQVSHKLAKSQLETATSEYQHMKHNFQRFPSIEERVTKRKDAAEQEVVKLERQLKFNADSQPGLAKSLAAAFLNISSKAEKARRVPEIAADAVSRQEFTELHERLAQQQQMLDKQQDQFARQQDLVDKQQHLIERLQDSYAEEKKATLQAKERAETTKKEMTQDFSKLESRIQEFDASVHTDIDRIRGDMQPQLDRAVEDAGRARLTIEGQSTAVTQITERLDGQGRVLSQLSSTVEAATNTVSGAQKSFVKLEEQMTTTKNEVIRLENKVSNTDNVRSTTTDRLEGYDQRLNYVGKLVKSLQSENTGIQKGFDDLALDVQKIKNAPKAVTRAPASGNSAAHTATSTDSFAAQVEEKFNSLEVALADLRQELKDDAEAQDETIGLAQDAQGEELAQTKEQLAALSTKVEELADTCSSSVQRLEQSASQNHAQIGVAYESIRDALTKAIQNTSATLQERIASLSEKVAVLEKRPVPAAQMPAPAITAAPSPTAQDSAQFRPVAAAAQSPRASNSRPGSTTANAQNNGVHSPRVPTSPFGFANGAPPHAREIAVLTDQIRGMAGTITNLKQRMDNLTTDEVVRGMADQFSLMYPAAKDFHMAVSALHKVDAALNSGQTELRGKVDELAERFVQGQLRVSKVEDAVTILRKDVEITISDAKQDFNTAMEAQTDVIIDVRHQVRAFADSAFGPSDR